MTAPIGWWHSTGEVSRLLRWLDAHEEHGPIDVATCIEVAEKPWNWSREHRQMLREQAEVDRQTNEALLQASVAVTRGARR